MKKWATRIVFISCVFTMVGWGSVPNEKNSKDDGYKRADTKHQGNDEDVKRAQGDERGGQDIHENKGHEDEEKVMREDNRV